MIFIVITSTIDIIIIHNMIIIIFLLLLLILLCLICLILQGPSFQLFVWGFDLFLSGLAFWLLLLFLSFRGCSWFCLHHQYLLAVWPCGLLAFGLSVAFSAT